MAPGKKRSFMTKNRGQYRYILVIKDCFSKFYWLIPAKTKSASEVHSILHNFFFYDEEPPKYLQTDNGTEFINEVVKKLCKSLGIRILHGRPYHPQSQGQLENLNKKVQKKLAKLLCHRPTEERAKLWPYLLPLVAKEIDNTWHHTIQDVPVRVLKGRHTAEFRYPEDEEFFDEVPFVDDGEIGEDDTFSFSEACPLQYSDEENDDDEHRTFEDVSVEPVFSFAERLELGAAWHVY